MTSANVYVPYLLLKKKGALAEFIALAAGAGLLSLLAQLRFYLPGMPVPVTGQTFGVALLALLWGKRALWVFLVYLAAGFLGAPVFAGAAGLRGASAGYLLGMGVASALMGWLSERGWGQGFWRAYFACVLGSVCVFLFGLTVLAQFVPAENLFKLGLWPFLPGDLLKSLAAAGIASQVNQRYVKSV